MVPSAPDSKSVMGLETEMGFSARNEKRESVRITDERRSNEPKIGFPLGLSAFGLHLYEIFLTSLSRMLEKFRFDSAQNHLSKPATNLLSDALSRPLNLIRFFPCWRDGEGSTFNGFGAFFTKWTITIFEPDRKFTLISFRTVISLLLLFFTLYGSREISENFYPSLYPNSFTYGMAIVALQFFSIVLLFFIPQRVLNKAFIVGLFLFDVVSISLAIYCTQGFQNDLFLIYFLVIFMTVIARKPSVSFLVAGIACVLYGVLFLKSYTFADLMHSSAMIRFPLLFIVAFFSSNIVQDLEAQEDLIHKMSHELKSPLTAIKTASKLLLEEFKNKNRPMEDQVRIKMISIIDRSSTKMNETIDDILELLRFEMGKVRLRKAPLSVEKMVQECVEEFAIPCAERGLTLISEVASPLPTITADELKLRQSILNLLTNAMKFTPAGGQITIGAQRADEQTGASSERLKTAGIKIFVKDTGVGIAPEQQKKIFNKFYQLNGANSGSNFGIGLGLALVKAIVEAHQGTLSVISVPGNGTVFSMRLPGTADSAVLAREKKYVQLS